MDLLTGARAFAFALEQDEADVGAVDAADRPAHGADAFVERLEATFVAPGGDGDGDVDLDDGHTHVGPARPALADLERRAQHVGALGLAEEALVVVAQALGLAARHLDGAVADHGGAQHQGARGAADEVFGVVCVHRAVDRGKEAGDGGVHRVLQRLGAFGRGRAAAAAEHRQRRDHDDGGARRARRGRLRADAHGAAEGAGGALPGGGAPEAAPIARSIAACTAAVASLTTSSGSFFVT